MVGLPPPKNFRMDIEDEIECEYFREDYMARHMADEPGDENRPQNSYSKKAQEWYNKCTKEEQQPFVDAVLKAAAAGPNDTTTQRHFFLTGAGGTGKTFTYNVRISFK
jgi:phage/plasmid-associated DNA primase